MNNGAYTDTLCYNTGMKNALIIILILAVGILGVLLLSKKSTNNINSSQTGISQTVARAPADSTTPTGKIINLANKDLTDVPKDIFNDTTATTLDVSGNKLSGSLPAEIRKMRNLQVLIAADNQMTGVPAEIGQLRKLRVINFVNNNLSGLPMELGNLSNLQTLDLRGNARVSTFDISQIQPKIPNAKILTN